VVVRRGWNLGAPTNVGTVDAVPHRTGSPKLLQEKGGDVTMAAKKKSSKKKTSKKKK
jgi:hypothetical protein